jgi:cytochrome oxidase Cu insertion factor (SCO1/SenC/PrrC family)
MLQGQYYLVYFGTTLCPDVCPLSLMRIMKA